MKAYLARNRITLGYLAAVWLMISVFLPAIRYGHDIGGLSGRWNWGFEEFIAGPLGIFLLQPGWYANIIILAAIKFLLTDRVLSWGWGLLSVSLAASVLLEYGRETCFDSCETTVGFGAGYWLWLALTAAITLVAFIDRLELEDAD
jgi:hypothetical protein